MTRIFSTALVCALAAAQYASASSNAPAPRVNQTVTPAQLRGIGFDQNLNAQIPLDLPFRDDQGAQVRLRDYYGQRPVVLALVYYECPMLCTEVLNGVLRAARVLTFNAGDQYDIVAVSINPQETPQLAAEKKKGYVNKYRRAGGERGWHFLTGTQDSIAKLAQAVGFRYRYDPINKQYAHAAGIMVTTPAGKVAKYLYGVEYSARDLRLALVDASANKIGNPVDLVLLYCFHYNPATGKYGLLIQRVLHIGGALTVAGIASLVGILLWFEKRRKRQRAEALP